jgi:hypothetical protein
MSEWKEATLKEKIRIILVAPLLLFVYIPVMTIQGYRNNRRAKKEEKEYYRKKREEEVK